MHIYRHKHIHTHKYSYSHTHTNTHTLIHTYTHMQYIHTQTHTHTRIHAHTHTRVQLRIGETTVCVSEILSSRFFHLINASSLKTWVLCGCKMNRIAVSLHLFWYFVHLSFLNALNNNIFIWNLVKMLSAVYRIKQKRSFLLKQTCEQENQSSW